MIIDATVSPENIRFPTDAELLNEAREWTVNQVKSVGKQIGERFRTLLPRCQESVSRFQQTEEKDKEDHQAHCEVNASVFASQHQST